MGKSQGISSNKLTQRPVKTGRAAHGRNEKAVSQIGSAMGNHVMDRDRNLHRNRVAENLRDAPRPTNAGQRLGNEVAASTPCGVGGGRTVMRSGSQGMQGAPNPGNPPPTGELFPGWPNKR